MFDAEANEWMFLIMKVKPVPRNEPLVLIGDRDIVDSYDDPMRAAKDCEKLNQDTSEFFHFIEARPVIGSVDCEVIEAPWIPTMPDEDFSDWERS